MSSLLGTRPRKRRVPGQPGAPGSRAGRKRKHYVVVSHKTRVRKAFLMLYKAKAYQAEHGGVIVEEIR